MLAGMSLDVFSFIFINTHSQICKSPLFIPIEFTCPMTVPSVPLWSETQPPSAPDAAGGGSLG